MLKREKCSLKKALTGLWDAECRMQRSCSAERMESHSSFPIATVRRSLLRVTLQIFQAQIPVNSYSLNRLILTLARYCTKPTRCNFKLDSKSPKWFSPFRKRQDCWYFMEIPGIIIILVASYHLGDKFDKLIHKSSYFHPKNWKWRSANLFFTLFFLHSPEI